MIEDVLEKVLKSQLQKQLEFELNGRIYKRGRFSLYRIETYNNNYEITFMFEKPNTDKVERFKIPHPFSYEHYEDDGHIFFDYRLITLTNNDAGIADNLRDLSEDYSKSKYFDKILKVHCKIPE